MKVFLELMWFFKQEKRAYLTGIILLFIVAFLELVPPKVIGIVVDQIAEGTLSQEKLWQWMGILLGAALMMYVLRFIWRIMIFGSAVKLSKLLRNRLYQQFTMMTQSFYQRRRIGDLMAHATNDLQAIQQTAGAGVLTLVDSLAVGGFVIITMAATISWKLTLICLIPMPIMAYLTNFYGSLLHNRFGQAQEAFSSLNDKTQESISGIKVIKTFGQEKEDIESFRDQSEDVVRKNLAVARVDSLFDPTISIIVGVSFFLAIVFGARYVIQGELTIGELVSFTTYLGLLIWPMLAFGWLFNIVERGRASYDRVSKLLHEKPDVLEQKGARKDTPSGDLQYHVDSFSYPNEEQAVLSNIHFTLKKGETLGIVGKTGAGKTSLIKALLREFPDINGDIKIGNESIFDYELNSLRSVFGYVPQDHFLFSASIQENIAFGKPDATVEEVQQAAKLAHIHDDIVQLTEGYDTVVGERGVSLSGGQKQRISIARALLMDPEILILDDSLSAVDAKTEEQILTSLKANRDGKTTIITAHRLSAIQHAHLILVLDEGEVVQRGTHEQLMAQEGWYKDMYIRQQLEDIVEHGG
ncbi:ABC transporter transmembrane domain-containing protein [Bacillus kexueae]|uniref:ABC transporter transmembrane domain-containing protein n=1 Tax=Aeribacillus kexueae TaxID=2078952 RepID=UPI001FAFFD97|nr:ABC transporter transmembrane domain-containing protein [Bacillus kexueae]